MRRRLFTILWFGLALVFSAARAVSLEPSQEPESRPRPRGEVDQEMERVFGTLSSVGVDRFAVKKPDGVTQIVMNYMGVIEGMMAVTGYDYFDEMLGTRKIFPRLLEGIRLIRADEGRHITMGMDYLRQKIAERPDYSDAVRQLFFQESLKVPTRTEFVFQPNAFGLDRERMTAIAYEHLEQRSREIGLT